MAQAEKTPTPRRQTGKSDTAYRTISEVSSKLTVPPHVLRFWESKFVQIKPLKRGGGRRYYRPEDIDLLRSIRELLYTEGYTIKGVQKLLRESPAKILPILTANPNYKGSRNAKLNSDFRPRDELERILEELVSLRDLLRTSPD